MIGFYIAHFASSISVSVNGVSLTTISTYTLFGCVRRATMRYQPESRYSPYWFSMSQIGVSRRRMNYHSTGLKDFQRTKRWMEGWNLPKVTKASSFIWQARTVRTIYLSTFGPNHRQPTFQVSPNSGASEPEDIENSFSNKFLISIKICSQKIIANFARWSILFHNSLVVAIVHFWIAQEVWLSRD